MVEINLTGDEVRALEVAGWKRCEGHCIYQSEHFHDEDENTIFQSRWMEPNGRFLIVGMANSEDGSLYWSNEDGWGYRSTATVFDEAEVPVSDPMGAVHREWLDEPA